MKNIDVLRSAVRSTFRNRLRTSLTVIAIVIGSFTLTITNGLGTGINAYIDDTVAALGADDVLTVTKTPDTSTESDDGIRQYDPNVTTVDSAGPPDGPRDGGTVTAITDAEIDTLREVDRVESAERQVQISTDFIQLDDDTQWDFTIGTALPGTTLQLAAGEQLDNDTNALQVAIPVDYVNTLECSDAEDCVGTTATIGFADGENVKQTVEAEIVAVAEATLGSAGAGSANDALTDRIYELQSVGLSDTEKTSYSAATVRFDPDDSQKQTATLRDELADLGYDSETVGEQIGSFRTVIDGIILVLNAFGIIALLAAGFGIVNTLLMSVQERTREIGLMKAVGTSRGKIFGLFSTEAVVIGFLGSALGASLGIVVGGVVSRALGVGLLGDLPGLVLIAFTPASIAGIVLLVMGIALLAGTLPAFRAARQNPIDALRYE